MITGINSIIIKITRRELFRFLNSDASHRTIQLFFKEEEEVFFHTQADLHCFKYLNKSNIIIDQIFFSSSFFERERSLLEFLWYIFGRRGPF